MGLGHSLGPSSLLQVIAVLSHRRALARLARLRVHHNPELRPQLRLPVAPTSRAPEGWRLNAWGEEVACGHGAAMTSLSVAASRLTNGQ